MNLLFLDTETTGKDENARLVQLAYKIGNKTENFYVRPPVLISFEAMSVHHITNEAVANLPTFEEISWRKEEVQELLNDNIMVAHNAPFDAEILRREGLQVGKTIDTLKVVQRLFDLSMYKLQFLRYRLGLETAEVRAHDAEGDIEVLEALFNYLYSYMVREMPELGNFPSMVLDRMIQYTNEPLLLRRISFGKYSGTAFADIPKDYLQWLKNKGDLEGDLIYTLDYYLQNKNDRIAIDNPNSSLPGF